MKEKAKGKKKMVILGIILLVIVLLVAGTVYLMTGPKNEDALSEPIAGENGTRSLVVYFSRSNVINAHGDVDAFASGALIFKIENSSWLFFPLLYMKCPSLSFFFLITLLECLFHSLL